MTTAPSLFAMTQAQSQAAHSMYHALYDAALFETAGSLPDVDAFALQDVALALCGDPYTKIDRAFLDAHDTTPAVLAFLRPYFEQTLTTMLTREQIAYWQGRQAEIVRCAEQADADADEERVDLEREAADQWYSLLAPILESFEE